jgi:WS/DGAT/MGAT family acyltransferase
VGFERLSTEDSFFLHIESPTLPQHVGGLILLEGEPFFDDGGRFRIDDVREAIGSRLHLVPRYRKKLMFVPFEQGRPVWVDDDDFDLTYHIRLTALPSPGTDEQLKALMGRLQSHPLDRGRPLWELWFVEGVDGDRVAIISKTHHCMVDGISGLDVAAILFDLAPEPTPIEPEPFVAERAPTPLELLVETLVERVTMPTEMVRSAQNALRAPQQAAGRIAEFVQSVLPLAPAASRAPEMPWNHAVSPHRRWEEARVPLDRIKAIKDAATEGGYTDGRCTVNDVVLAASTGALRAHLLDVGHPVDDVLIVKAMVPVSLRDESERNALGNRVSLLAAELPVGDADPKQWLSRVHAMQTALKASGQAIGADRLIQMGEFLPPTVLGLASRAIVRSRLVNMVITNVPGPQFPLYCMGARVLDLFPYVQLAENLGLVIAVISYDGRMEFGLTGDRDLMPGLAGLAAHLVRAVDDLADAVGVE